MNNNPLSSHTWKRNSLISHRHQRFGLRKLSVGVVSVMLGVSFLMGTSLVGHADEIASVTTPTEQSTATTTSDASATGKVNANQQSKQTNNSQKQSVETPNQDESVQGSKGSSTLSAKQVVSDNNSNAPTNDAQNNTLKAASQKASAPAVSQNQQTNNVNSQNSSSVMFFKAPEEKSVPAEPTENQVTMTLNFVDHDENNKSIGSKTISGQAGDDVTDQVKADYQGYFDQHYEMLMDDPLGIAWYTGFDGKKIELPDSDQSYTVLLSHQVEMLFGDPTDPQCDGRTIPAGGSKDGITQNDLERHFTRTIVFHYKDGTIKKDVQTMNPDKIAYRHVTVDLVDPSLNDFSDWAIKNVNVVQLGFAELSDDDLAKYNPQDEEIWEKGSLQPIFSVPEIGFYDLNKDFGDKSNINVDLYVGQCNFNFKYEDALKHQTLHSDYIDDHTDNNVWQVGVNPAPDSSYNFKKQMQFDASANLEEVAQIPGYQLTGAIVDGQKIADAQTAIQKIGALTNDHDHNITLEYTQLLPLYIHYTDIDTNKDIFELYIPTDQKALPADPTGQFNFKGDNYIANPIAKLDYPELGDAENYQPNIPGYTYTGKSEGATSGIVGQTYKPQDSTNSVDIYYYYKVSDPVIAEYSRAHPQFGKTLNVDLHPKQVYIGNPIDYTQADQGLINYLKQTGANYVGGINTAGGISTITENDTWYYFLANRDVKVNYINEATGEVMKSGYADRVTATSNLADSTDQDIPTEPSDQDDENNLNGQWTTRKLQFANMIFDKTDRSTSGRYGALQQEVNYYYLPVVTKQTDTKTATRLIHYVANTSDGESLQKDVTQKVTLKGTYFTDANDQLAWGTEAKDSKGNLIKDADGHQVYVVDTSKSGDAKETWTIDTDADIKDNHDVTANETDDQTFDFSNAAGDEAPTVISVDPTWSKDHHNVNTGKWYYVGEVNNSTETVDPSSEDWQDALNPITLIYEQQVQAVTPKKTATRTVYYVEADNSDLTKATKLIGYDSTGTKADHFDQKVTLVTNNTYDIDGQQTTSDTYYVDSSDPTKKVNVKTVKDADGNPIYVVDSNDTKPVTSAWAIDTSNDVTKGSDGKFTFAQPTNRINITEAPETIVDPTDPTNAKKTWYHVATLDRNDQSEDLTDPNQTWTDASGQETDSRDLDPVYLVYKQKASYNVHYLDVTGHVDDYSKGTELTKHRVSNIGNGNATDTTIYYVGDTPNDSDQLWTTYGDEGYVLVGTQNVDADHPLAQQKLTSTNVQDQYVYLMRVAQEHDDAKYATRAIEYRANTATGEPLQTNGAQKVTLKGAYYTDPTNKSGKMVNTITVTGLDGQKYIVVDPTSKATPKEVWSIDTTAKDNKDVTDSDGKFSFATTTDAESPQTISVGQLWSDDHNKINIGTWYHVQSLDRNNQVDGSIVDVDGNPTWADAATGKETNDLTLQPIILIYRQKKTYGVHYRLVDNAQSSYQPTDGTDLGHTLTNIGNGKYVGDPTDDSQNLWDYRNDYVLVGLSDNATTKGSKTRGDELAKQTLTDDTSDQYVYLMKKAKKNTTSKSATRLIHYVEYNKADVTKGTPLQKDGTQQVTLTGTYYTDPTDTSKTPKLVNTKTIKDINGHEVLVVDDTDTNPATTTWVIDNTKADTDVTANGKNNQTFDFAVATGKELPATIGDWHHYASADINKLITVDPANSWKKTLDPLYIVYRQQTQYNVHYIVVNKINDNGKYQPSDGTELTGHEIPNIGKDFYVGDPTDASAKLWKTYTNDGYVLVGLSANAQDGKLGKQTLTHNVQDQYVYLMHGTTPSTNKTKKDEIKSEKTSVSRHIYYRDAQTGALVRDELKKYGIKANVPDIIQTVDYVRVPLYDAVDGHFLGFAALFLDPDGFAKLDADGQPEIKKDPNGQPLILTKDDKQSWVPTGMHTEYPKQGSPDLTKYGYKKASSLVQSEDQGNGALVANQAADPTKNGADVNVYYFHDEAPVSTGTPESGVDQQELEKTFSRKIVYRGTKDNGKSYQSVNGAPNGQNNYIQTVTYTRKAIIDKVTKKVLHYTNWTVKSGNMDAVSSKLPKAVGYDEVDIPSVSAVNIDPKSTVTDLGTTTVTYSAKVQPSTPGTKPSTPGAKPSTPSTTPTTPGTKPSTPGAKPSTPSTTPTTPGTKPSTPGTKPSKPSTTPSKPSTTPTTPGTTPSTPGTKPSTPSTTPTTPGTKPSKPSTTPTTPGTKPSTPSTTPTTPGTKPSTPSTTPTTPGTKPSTPGTKSSKPSTTPTTPDKKPSTPKTPQQTPLTPVTIATPVQTNQSGTPTLTPTSQTKTGQTATISASNGQQFADERLNTVARAKSAVNNDHADHAELPQTGNQHNQSASILGLAVASLLGAFGLTDRRHRRD